MLRVTNSPVCSSRKIELVVEVLCTLFHLLSLLLFQSSHKDRTVFLTVVTADIFGEQQNSQTLILQTYT